MVGMEQPRPNRDAESTHLIRSRGGASDPRRTWCTEINRRIEAECIADTTCIPCLQVVRAECDSALRRGHAAHRINQLTRDGLAALDRGALHTASGSALDTLVLLNAQPRRPGDSGQRFDIVVPLIDIKTGKVGSGLPIAEITVPAPPPRCSFVPADGLAAIVLAKARGGTTSGDIMALRDRFGCKAVSTHEILGMSDPLADDVLEDNGDPAPRHCCADHVGHVLSDRDGWVSPIGFDPFVADSEPPGVSIVPGGTGVARAGFGPAILLSSLPGVPGWLSDIDDGMMQHARQAGAAIAASPVSVSGGPDITAAAMHLARHSTMTYQQAHAVMTRFVALPSDVRFALSGADGQAMVARCIARESLAFGGPPITSRSADAPGLVGAAGDLQQPGFKRVDRRDFADRFDTRPGTSSEAYREASTVFKDAPQPRRLSLGTRDLRSDNPSDRERLTLQPISIVRGIDMIGPHEVRTLEISALLVGSELATLKAWNEARRLIDVEDCPTPYAVSSMEINGDSHHDGFALKLMLREIIAVQPKFAGPLPGTLVPCRAPDETDESLRARIHVWLHQVEPERAEQGKLPTEHTVILRHQVFGEVVLKCYDPTITRLDHGRGEMRLTTTCSTSTMWWLREQYEIGTTLAIEDGSGFLSGTARIAAFAERSGGGYDRVVTMTIHALNVQPAG